MKNTQKRISNETYQAVSLDNNKPKLNWNLFQNLDRRKAYFLWYSPLTWNGWLHLIWYQYTFLDIWIRDYVMFNLKSSRLLFFYNFFLKIFFYNSEKPNDKHSIMQITWLKHKYFHEHCTTTYFTVF